MFAVWVPLKKMENQRWSVVHGFQNIKYKKKLGIGPKLHRAVARL